MVVSVHVADTVGCSPFTLSINDSSTHIANWLWSFGDGTTAATQSPSHIYTGNGVYPVTLQATSPTGCVQVINPVATISTYGPIAQFSSTSTVSCAPTIVNFTNQSTGADSWVWEFGDNNASVIENPVHIYNQPGTYDVTLVVSDSAGCSDTLARPGLVHITGSVAAFTISSVTGCSPMQVQFADSSISAFNWSWNFGDGTTSTQQNPSHVYTSPGNYTVTLITEDTTGCQSVFSNPVPVEVLDPPVSLFSMSDTSGCAPLTISMQNLSQGNGLTSHWEFGDGTISAALQPSHTFQLPGSYFITLITSNASGCHDTLVASVPVVAEQAPSAGFYASPVTGCNPLQVRFINTTTDTINTTWHWDFGNGAISTLREPLYTYHQPGIYTVSLTATNNGVCSGTFTRNNLIVVSDGSPPPPVQIKSVSVEGPNTIDITWGNLPVQDLAAYKLYRYDDTAQQYFLVYADNNPGNTSMNVTSSITDTVPGTANSTYTYVVSAENLCGNETAFALHTPHTTINLSCVVNNQAASLSWNSYGGCAVGAYEIYRLDDTTGSYNLVGTTGPLDTTFTDTTVYCDLLVTYRVLATGLCGEPFDAWSDAETIQVPGMLANQRVDVVRSTVEDDSYVFTEWTPPAMAPHLVTSFEIYRSTDLVNYTLVATVPATQISYSDHDVHVHLQNYSYRVKVKNHCELETSPGHVGTSILLRSLLDDQNRSVLQWTPYRKWDAGVDFYVIERLDEFGHWQQIKTVDGNTLHYTDR
jgi:PKD repeat protein